MARIPILIFFWFQPLVVYAQGIVWQNTIGGSNVDIASAIVPVTNNGFLTGGYSWSSISGDKTENTNGLADYWIVRVDEAGNLMWQQTIGGSKDDELQCITNLPNGGFLLGGDSHSGISGDKTADSLGSGDIWMVRVDDGGQIVWQRSLGGTGQDLISSSIAIDGGGYVWGCTSASDVSADKSENSFGLWDYWVIRTDSLGNTIWQKTIGGADEDGAHAIQQTPDLGYLVAGTSRSGISGNKSVANYGGQDIWLVRLDSAGSILWQKEIGGNADDQLLSLVATPDQGFLISAFSNSGISGDKTQPCFGGYDIWVIKLDSNGNIIWQQTIGGSAFDFPSNAFLNTDGSYLIAGWTLSSISGNKIEKAVGSRDLWVIKLDSTGQMVWQNTIGGIYTDYMGDACLSSDGDILLAASSSSGISGDKSEPCLGTSEDYWLVKVSGKSNVITGTLYADVNSNDIRDTLEAGLDHQKIIELNSGRFAFTDEEGGYELYLNDSGSFTITPPFINYFIPNPATHGVSFPGFYLSDSLNNFAFQPSGTVNDLWVGVSPISPFRAGGICSYDIAYRNLGNTVLIASLTFYPDTSLAYFSSSVTPTFVDPDSIVFSLGNLYPFTDGHIVLETYVDQFIPIGSVLQSEARIYPEVNDAAPANNFNSCNTVTIGPLDPNRILVNYEQLYSTQFPNPPELEYIIQFQNTGNDTAFSAQIINPLDTNLLDLTTLEFVAASHPVNMQFIYYQKNLMFRFNNILLVDSNTNEPKSHGFVRYRIKPKNNLVTGTTVANAAAIVFDYNDPVITNTAFTVVVPPLGLPDPSNISLEVFPNPVTGFLQVQCTGGEYLRSSPEVYGMDGQKVPVAAIQMDPTNFTHWLLDCNHLRNGVYLLRQGAAVVRFVKL